MLRFSLHSARPLMMIMLGIMIFSCSPARRKDKSASHLLAVYHAGSLSVPMKNLAEAFKAGNPEVEFRMEAAGSIHCIRKITELNQACDILAVADYSLIDEMMIPDHTGWNVLFATNELCLAYTGKSRGAGEIDQDNWFRILLKPDISFGRSDPDSDPCGYRTILALQLAESCYPGGIGWKSILEKDQHYIRPKETDLNALLETQAIDFVFTYRSVAIQHDFRYLTFPDSINLSRPELDSWYSTASVEIPGSRPGERVLKKGTAMYYGITIPSEAINPDLAKRFIRFILDPKKGGAIIEAAGQNAIAPVFSEKSLPADGLF